MEMGARAFLNLTHCDIKMPIREDGWAPGPVWEGAESLTVPRFDPRIV